MPTLTATLRRSGGSLIVTMPQEFVTDNGLAAGDALAVTVRGSEVAFSSIEPDRQALRDGYRALAADPAREADASGWIEALAGDVAVQTAPKRRRK
jgi:hypothetical protein